MPGGVRFVGSESDLRLRRVDASSWSPQAAFADQFVGSRTFGELFDGFPLVVSLLGWV